MAMKKEVRMFTGIVEETGTIKFISSAGSSGRIAIQARKVLEGTKTGDSIAVNGICLTVTSLRPDSFTADFMAETMRRSSLKELRAGQLVNLERAMAADGRFGGHLVTGHIDGTGIIRAFVKEENAVWITVQAPENILRLVVEKGSVCIDGVSLTVAAVLEDAFQVSVIPHTASETALLRKKPGELVNLENDIIGKYIEKLICLEKRPGERRKKEKRKTEREENRTEPEESRTEGEVKASHGITMQFLEENGIGEEGF